MIEPIQAPLRRQFETASRLAHYHLAGLTDEECLWRPARKGPQAYLRADGRWRGDWPDREGYDVGPASVGWLTWHIGFWWSMTLDHAFGDATLSKDHIHWPGSATGARDWIGDLEQQWLQRLDQITDEELQSSEMTRWPFQDRPFIDIVGWVTVELTKNAAEIGYARFLYAVQNGR